MPEIVEGEIIIHKAFGKGTVLSVTETTLKVLFPSVGEKTLGLPWVCQNCKIKKIEKGRLMLNKESIKKLIDLNKNNRDSLDFIKSCIDSFEQYHKAVFDDQMFQIIYSGGALDGDEYRERRSSVDRTRTIHHNSIISNVNILNRMANKAGLEPVYDGIVSEERPYRREVANAVFEYIESIINSRN